MPSSAEFNATIQALKVTVNVVGNEITAYVTYDALQTLSADELQPEDMLTCFNQHQQLIENTVITMYRTQRKQPVFVYQLAA